MWYCMCSLVEILCVLEEDICLVCWQLPHNMQVMETFGIQPTYELSLFSFKLSKLVAGSLQLVAAYSLNWGAQEIWGKGGGETLAVVLKLGQTSCRPCANLMPTSYRLHANLMPTSCRPCANLRQTSCQPHADLIPTLGRPHANLMQTLCQPQANLMPSSCRPDTNLRQT